MGLYRVTAGTGDLTLIGSTANDVTVFAGANTAFSRAITTPVAVVAGEWLAVGILVVSTGTLPSIVGPVISSAAWPALFSSPRLATIAGGQTDLPATFLSSSLAVANPV